MSFTAFGQRFIVLGSAQAAIDLLEKRGAVYSDRPYIPMAGKYMGWDQIVAFSSYGDECRAQRRFLHKSLGGRGQSDKITQYHAVQERETRRFLGLLCRTPEDFVKHINTLVTARVLTYF